MAGSVSGVMGAEATRPGNVSAAASLRGFAVATRGSEYQVTVPAGVDGEAAFRELVRQKPLFNGSEAAIIKPYIQAQLAEKRTSDSMPKVVIFVPKAWIDGPPKDVAATETPKPTKPGKGKPAILPPARQNAALTARFNTAKA